MIPEHTVKVNLDLEELPESDSNAYFCTARYGGFLTVYRNTVPVRRTYFNASEVGYDVGAGQTVWGGAKHFTQAYDAEEDFAYIVNYGGGSSALAHFGRAPYLVQKFRVNNLGHVTDVKHFNLDPTDLVGVPIDNRGIAVAADGGVLYVIDKVDDRSGRRGEQFPVLAFSGEDGSRLRNLDYVLQITPHKLGMWRWDRQFGMHWVLVSGRYNNSGTDGTQSFLQPIDKANPNNVLQGTTINHAAYSRGHTWSACSPDWHTYDPTFANFRMSGLEFSNGESDVVYYREGKIVRSELRLYLVSGYMSLQSPLLSVIEIEDIPIFIERTGLEINVAENAYDASLTVISTVPASYQVSLAIKGLPDRVLEHKGFLRFTHEGTLYTIETLSKSYKSDVFEAIASY